MSIFKNAFINENVEMMPYFFWLSSLNAIGIKTYIKMQSFFGSPKELFYANKERLEKSNIFTKKQLELIAKSRAEYDPLQEYENMIRKGIRMISYESTEYPLRLKEIPSAPINLFLIGKMPAEDRPVVSVIGARECSNYGINIAKEIGTEFAKKGISLVSGMARGIDSVSEEAAVYSGGYSMAVLGGGPDYLYPKESSFLYEALVEKGGILSEYVPGTVPLPQFFAARNRIISGISDSVCVIEARRKSGTMITVDAALEQGREVYVVPGKITDVTSSGCNELIRQGASIITDVPEFVNDIVSRFSVCNKNTSDDVANDYVKPDENPITLSLIESLTINEQKIISSISDESFTIDEMAVKTGIKASDILLPCINLTRYGALENKGAGRFLVTSFGINMRNHFIQ